jgi:hypothetical protein
MRKFKKNRIVGIITAMALVTMFTVNIRYSLNGYGIKSMNLHPEVWAQTNGTGGGDTSGGNTTGGNKSGGNTSGGETSGGDETYGEELAGIELTYFNGRMWNNMDKHWLGTDWYPKLLICQITETVSLIYISYSETYPGHYMSCKNGNGNCYISTSCIKD